MRLQTEISCELCIHGTLRHVYVDHFSNSCCSIIVNRNSLECADDPDDSEDDPSEDANSDSDDAVCATHGVTYPSLCRLLQDTGNEAVAYAGECDREECQGGRVSTWQHR